MWSHPQDLVASQAIAAAALSLPAARQGLTNHYKKVHCLLEELQEKREVELLCMLALMVGMILDMVVYNVPQGEGDAPENWCLPG